MKKLIAVLLCLILTLAMVACGNNGTPNDNENFEDAQKNFDNVEASTDKKDIEKTIKDLFGVEISLPSADSYSADKMEVSGSSMYIVLVSGSSLNAEQYYNSVKSKFSKWTAVDASKTFTYETDKVTYGAVFEDDDGDLGIAFSMTDKELTDAFKDLVGDTSTFRNEIKTRSGLDITFPEIVTSVGLPSSNTVGSKVEYSGMLLAGGANLDAAGFQAVIDALTPQLTGYTKSEPIQGTNTTTVQWVNNDDPTKYFEISLSDYDGSTYVYFGFTYSDRSLLDPWPATEIESFLGVANAVPEYGGDYRSLEFSQSEYNPEFCDIEMNGADEEEYNAWLSSLVAEGFTEESVDQSYGDPITQYYKQINEGVFLTVEPRFYGYGTVDIRLTKEVYTNLDWPTEALVTAYGQNVANAIPQIEKASKRSFIFEEGTYYDTLKVENNVSEDLFTEYSELLVNAGFKLTQSSSYSKNSTYEYTFDNWDKLKVGVSYTEDGYSDSNVLRLEFTFTEYTGFGMKLPENVEIVYEATMTIGESSGSSTSRIVKIGENYYFEDVFYGYNLYCEFDSATRTWTLYKGTVSGDTVNWSVYKEDVNRTAIDNEIKSAFQGKNKDASKVEPAETKTYFGVTCVKYTYTISYGASSSYEYTYWVDEATGLVFDYLYSYEGGSMATVITDYDTTVTSFGNIDLPE